MNNIKSKFALLALALSIGASMTGTAAARESGTCLLFKERCNAGIPYFCQQYANQCPDDDTP